MKSPLAFASIEPLAQLKAFRKEKRFTDCLEVLEERGIQGDTAIFVLSVIGRGEA